MFDYNNPAECDERHAIADRHDPEAIIVARRENITVYAAAEVLTWQHETIGEAKAHYWGLLDHIRATRAGRDHK